MGTLLLIYVLAGQDRNPFVRAEASWLNHSFKGRDICLVSLSLSMPLKNFLKLIFLTLKTGSYCVATTALADFLPSIAALDVPGAEVTNRHLYPRTHGPPLAHCCFAYHSLPGDRDRPVYCWVRS